MKDRRNPEYRRIITGKRWGKLHRRLWKVQRNLRKAALREKIDKDIEDYINNIKNGL